MAISRRVGLILVAIVIIGALIAAYVIYSGQASQKGALNDRVNRAKAALPALDKQKQDLQEQLTNAQSSAATSQAQFPQSVESIEYGEYLYEIAAESGVQLTSLTFPQPGSVTVGAVTYSVVSLTLPISGTVDNIFKFITALRTDDRFASTQITAITMNMGGATPAAAISVTIYAHQG